MNVTNYFTNMTDIGALLQIPNTVTGGWFWLGMQILVFIVSVIALLGSGFEVALLVAGFISLISGLFLVYMELLSWRWLMLFLGVILFILFYTVWNNRKRD